MRVNHNGLNLAMERWRLAGCEPLKFRPLALIIGRVRLSPFGDEADARRAIHRFELLVTLRGTEKSAWCQERRGLYESMKDLDQRSRQPRIAPHRGQRMKRVVRRP